MTNTKLLQDAIRASGLKKSFLAEKCGMSGAWLQKKVLGEADFRVSEIEALRDALHLSYSDIAAIFFCQEVDETSTMEARS